MFKAVKSFYLASYTLKIPQTRITRLSSQYLYQWNATSFFIKTITSSAGFFPSPAGKAQEGAIVVFSS